MSAAAYAIRQSDAGRTLEISGDWSALTLGAQALNLEQAMAGASGPTRLDLSRVGRLDTAGAYAILKATLPTLAPSPMPDETSRLFDMVRPIVEDQRVAPPHRSALFVFFDQFGRGIVNVGREAYSAADFAGHLLVELGRTLRHPSSLRGISLARMMESAGVDALPIILTMNFFIGAVVASVGASLLASLGVSIFTVQLVGVSVLREFAVLITGILLAGRSASAFAAQIGSMKMSQEVDAMQVIGVDPFRALVIPRVLAMLVMMPLVSFAAMVAGLAGGLIVSWATLGISPIFFAERLHHTVSVHHFWIGMSKTPLLAILIAMAGCRHGLSVAGDVESLGGRVTTAVVQAIFMIILFDAVFAIIYMKLHL